MSEVRLRVVAQATRERAGDLPKPEMQAARLEDAASQTSDEQWRTVAEFPDYEVSNRGRLRRTIYVKSWPNSDGYLEAELWDANIQYKRRQRGFRRKVHRLVALAFLPNPDALPEVNHKDRNRANPDLDNLEWVTAKGNSEHSWSFPDRHKTVPRGEHHKMSKLSEPQIRCIRAFRGLWRQRSMAPHFGVSQHTIMWIQTRKTWDHVN